MQVSYYREQNLSYVVIDDYLTEEEHGEVLAEAKDLKRLAASAEITGAAEDNNNNHKKTGTGVFVDPLYTNNRMASPVLCMGRKIFSSELCEVLAVFDVVFSFISKSKRDETLINYYTPGQEYKAHCDVWNITAITLLGWGDFTGGGFCFPDQDVKVKFKQGRTIVFPSCAKHCSESVEGPEGVCRVSVAHFIGN
tara:strand:- start:110 stop:694 length:585 start_codon:yes stop_codon:yes gene_type:complete